tara:strand:+ start:433 stop:1161 length:729 start_codon:yes stop_codon:yes gene_type:complete
MPNRWGTTVDQPQDVLDLRNRYRGETLFVVGNGPSLLEMPRDILAELQNHFTMGVNRLLWWGDLPFTPWAMAISEAEHVAKLDEMMMGRDGGVTHRFVCHWTDVVHPGWQWVAKAPDDMNMWRDGAEGLREPLEPLPSGSSTCLTVGVQLGLWMGFDCIYLLGCDNTTTGSSFSDKWQRGRAHLERVVWSAKVAEDEMRCGGRELYDCTPGGGLQPTLRYLPLDMALYIDADKRQKVPVEWQ